MCDVSEINTESSGTGTIVTPSRVVTALHVLRGKPSVIYKDKRIKTTPIAIHPENDWALLQLDEPVAAPEILIRRNPLENNERVTAFGYGQGLSDGQVVPNNRPLFSFRSLFRNKTLQRPFPTEGDSGGPIFDKDNNLCGVIVCHYTDRWHGFSMCSGLYEFCSLQPINGMYLLKKPE